MEFKAELENQFPFQDEVDFPLELFQVDKKDVPQYHISKNVRLSKAFQQILDINAEESKPDCEQMELEKRDASNRIQMELEKRGAPFKYGLVGPFLLKFSFEDQEHVPNSEYYDSDDGDNPDEDCYGLRAFRPPNAHEVVLKFLKQGYDVDCCPPPKLCSPFMLIGPHIEKKVERYRNLVMGAVHFAIHKINVETGKSYMFVKLDNVVGTTCTLILLTFSVKEEEEANSEVVALRAMVSAPYGTLDYKLEEWMFKPPPPPPTTEEKS